MAFNLCLCCWFLSRERWFIKLKFFHLSLVVRREGTLNRNLEICAYLLSGLWKVTENVSVVKKTLPPLCLIVLSDPRNNSSQFMCWPRTGKSKNLSFLLPQRADWTYKSLFYVRRESTVLARAYLKRTAKLYHPYFPKLGKHLIGLWRCILVPQLVGIWRTGEFRGLYSLTFEGCATL